MITFHNDQVLKDDLILRAADHREADRLRQTFGFFGMVKDRGVSTRNEAVLRNSMRMYGLRDNDHDLVINAEDDPRQWKGCGIGCLATPTIDFNQESKIVEFLIEKFWHRLDSQAEAETLLERDFGFCQMLTRVVEVVFEGLAYEQAIRWPEQFARSVPVGVDISNRDVQLFCDHVEELTTYSEAMELNEAGEGTRSDQAESVRDQLIAWLSQPVEREAPRLPAAAPIAA